MVMLHYKINGFLHMELLVRNSFQKHSVWLIFERRLYPLLPLSNYAPAYFL